MTQQTSSPDSVTEFTAPASKERIASIAQALERHNIEAIVVDTGAEARERVLSMLLEGSTNSTIYARKAGQCGNQEIHRSTTRGWMTIQGSLEPDPHRLQLGGLRCAHATSPWPMSRGYRTPS